MERLLKKQHYLVHEKFLDNALGKLYARFMLSKGFNSLPK